MFSSNAKRRSIAMKKRLTTFTGWRADAGEISINN
jgi:hypothetical protein